MLSVRHIMQTGVVTVTPDMTARDLARLLANEGISGAPVLDGHGELAGVVSATDLVRLAGEYSDTFVAVLAPGTEEPIRDWDADPFGYFLTSDLLFDGQHYLAEFPESALETVLVNDIMTPVPFAVAPEMSVPELCEFMVRGRIHRAVVVEEGQLLGIVTTVDVLRAVAERSPDSWVAPSHVDPRHQSIDLNPTSGLPH